MRAMYAKMRKSLGNKRNELLPEHITEVVNIYESCVDGERSRVLPNEAFGYHRVVVERPLRVRYDVTEAGIATVAESKPYQALPDSDATSLVDGLQSLVGSSYATAAALEVAMAPVFAKLAKAPAPLKKSVLAAFMVRDPEAEPILGAKGALVPDPELRDTENVPFADDIGEFIAREVIPFAPDAVD